MLYPSVTAALVREVLFIRGYDANFPLKMGRSSIVQHAMPIELVLPLSTCAFILHYIRYMRRFAWEIGVIWGCRTDVAYGAMCDVRLGMLWYDNDLRRGEIVVCISGFGSEKGHGENSDYSLDLEWRKMDQCPEEGKRGRSCLRQALQRQSTRSGLSFSKGGALPHDIRSFTYVLCASSARTVFESNISHGKRCDMGLAISQEKKAGSWQLSLCLTGCKVQVHVKIQSKLMITALSIRIVAALRSRKYILADKLL
ncbi:hypothetical protein EAF00_011511 [Botryotinia globosa]|nr:hypothetical protein EAF00_011511 [Botryotinia globosa]